MARYLVSTRRAERGSVQPACDAVAAEPGVTVVNADDPHMVTIDASEETADRFIYDLGNGQWNIPALRKALAEVFEKNVAVHEFEVEHDFARIGVRTMLLNARPMHRGQEARPMLLLAIDDITMRRTTEQELRTSA